MMMRVGIIGDLFLTLAAAASTTAFADGAQAEGKIGWAKGDEGGE